MLRPVERDSENWFYCWINGWVALDFERGAYLLRSNGRSRGCNVYWLIVKEPQTDFKSLTQSGVVYRKRLKVEYGNDPLSLANHALDTWTRKDNRNG